LNISPRTIKLLLVVIILFAISLNYAIALESTHNAGYVQKSYQQANKLWKELKEMRNDSNFHKHGYALCCKLGKWNVRRRDLLMQWRDYLKTLTTKSKYTNDGTEIYNLTTALLSMKYIGRDWYRNNGRNTKKDTTDLIKEVEQILLSYKD